MSALRLYLCCAEIPDYTLLMKGKLMRCWFVFSVVHLSVLPLKEVDYYCWCSDCFDNTAYRDAEQVTCDYSITY